MGNGAAGRGKGERGKGEGEKGKTFLPLPFTL